MSVHMELPFLLRVVLEFTMKEELINFMCINHKCEDVIRSLKITPKFINIPSYRWFFTHFTPDTLDCHCVDASFQSYLEQVKCIRSPTLVFFAKDKLLTDEFASKFFPKITRIVLYSSENRASPNIEYIKEVNAMVLKHSHDFQKLVHLSGDIKTITEFLESYTENGKEKYIKLPSIIVLNSLRGYSIQTNYEVLSYIKRIEVCVPDNGVSQIFLISFRQAENENDFVDFRRVQYYYRNVHSRMCTKWSDHLYCEKGVVNVEGQVNGNAINRTIENVYPYTVEMRYVNTIDPKFELWSVPMCIQDFVLINSRVDVPAVFPITMPGIKTLKLFEVDNFIFSTNFENVETVVLKKCIRVTFDEKTQFEKLRVMWIESCTLISLKGYTKTELERVTIKATRSVDIEKRNDNLKNIDLINIIDIKIMSANASCDVYIENGKAIQISQRVFDHEITVFESIPDTNYNRNERGYKMRRFIPMSLESTVDHNVISRFDDYDPIYKGIDMVTSRFFSSRLDTSALEIKVLRNNNSSLLDWEYIETVTAPDGLQSPNFLIQKVKGVRYYEVNVTGVSIMSIGVINRVRYDEFMGCHVGWYNNSIGYHSDDGKVHSTLLTRDERDDEFYAYGNDIGFVNVVGCGYIQKTKEVFFTINGNLLGKYKIDFDELSAAIAFDVTKPITVNYGNLPFAFDVKKMEVIDEVKDENEDYINYNINYNYSESDSLSMSDDD
ncbi:hypothetical protein EIN_122820 [Entamoeba invadens IP1]|uniref:SPRY domain-containing protein n=1 Tax=Entamoeba invadens IP1 TaxID=370355 RepID=A0A0A1UEK3_ENTIV|nr:hypothetical protein EIN_122820 [Entamoeba invadens IP1]ELP92331.1 hypothetical protein EIN_122820 [Entamoeba invadens IP1]|eukprot:XP_004259102.1 hypothetical protein EIN_122820 [Entamoeba invadens IP1]